jgi:hypothetical protein
MLLELGYRMGLLNAGQQLVFSVTPWMIDCGANVLWWRFGMFWMCAAASSWERFQQPYSPYLAHSLFIYL